MKTARLTVLATALALAACGDKPDPEDASTSASGTSAATGSAARSGAGDAVAAVLQSAGAPLAKLSFVLDSRPVKGRPFTLRLLVSAAAPVAGLTLSAASVNLEVTPADGQLAIESADHQATHDLTITAQQEGLTELTVRLKTDSAESVYAIPLLVSAAGNASAGNAASSGAENGG